MNKYQYEDFKEDQEFIKIGVKKEKKETRLQLTNGSPIYKIINEETLEVDDIESQNEDEKFILSHNPLIIKIFIRNSYISLRLNNLKDSTNVTT